ncbi:Deoxyribodipyrimidine photo-lyase type II [Malonomonas rubra DSM 5091]|uniref:Deoxyribodipyrimidine photo-lyase n=1 Tax=Malonomonas rubra DSM 5091 TaxID=1122189 RepID=A0A1M6G1S8_MALRU|nr:deoxyribodipyrimidine photolyase [Malonomonas rubra]SHJ03854.1 Deoxyribodipyrimidine photo-lyase type II [Malonomonas rubra DSM 5091]
MSETPAIRLRQLNDAPLNQNGEFVLYWMTAFRRPFYNFALQRACEWSQNLRKPLLILEALRCDYPYASDRLHRFVLQGMADNAEHFSATPAGYYPYVETAKGAGKGLLKALAEKACLVVGDDHPGFFYPQMLSAAAEKLSVQFDVVDSNGLLPLRAADKAYPTAYAFRRFLQKNLPGHLFEFPLRDPVQEIELPSAPIIPTEMLFRWPEAGQNLLAENQQLSQLPIDHSVTVCDESGGWQEAEFYLRRFLDERLPHYLQRSEPDRQVSSELSAYLHFGHISSHQVTAELFAQEDWSIAKLGPETKGKKSGWWGLSESAESFLDELVTWREVGFNGAVYLPDYDRYSSLPEWARVSLAKHRKDPRASLYSLDQFERAQTHDPLWNAAQNQLLQEGKIQNYLRMLWGKKILEWSPDAETALQTMLYLNDKYALDGRDPNSVSGIFWCFGRYDRAWGPERPIFGKIRYMSSENTARKFSVKGYLRKYGGVKTQDGQLQLFANLNAAALDVADSAPAKPDHS